jgi:hypothetical protein
MKLFFAAIALAIALEAGLAKSKSDLVWDTADVVGGVPTMTFTFKNRYEDCWIQVAQSKIKALVITVAEGCGLLQAKPYTVEG